MNSLFRRIAIGLSLAAFIGCGTFTKKSKESDNSALTADEKAKKDKEDQELEKAKSGQYKIGILHLVPDEIGVAGMVTYTMYETGLLVYEGYYTYKPYPWWPEYDHTESFSGRYMCDPRSFMSATYANLGDRHADFKLQMEVTEMNGNLNVVDVNVREGDEKGRFEIDTSDQFIDIQYAEAHGVVAGVDLAIHVKR